MITPPPRSSHALIVLAALTWAVVATVWQLGGSHVKGLQSVGAGTFKAVAASDPVPGQFDWRVLIELSEGVEVVARFEATPPVEAGDRLVVAGRLRETEVTFRGKPVSGELDKAEILSKSPPFSPLRRAANALRSRIIENLEPERSSSRALLAGFLVGDTSQLPRIDNDALRRAGLSHFVAVSGSNVALFLVAWWLIFAPLALLPRIRWALGLLGLAFFVIVTRGEPSVIRAAVMAGVVLVVRAAGLPLDTWSALSLAVVGSLIAAPRYALDVGFGLSVAATAGVLLGARMFDFKPKSVATVLGASLGAQVAVAPVLIAVFGSMPLLSPLANLAAAPIVTLATAASGVGALLGLGWVVGLGSWLAGAVLGIARLAAPWPQVGWGTLIAAGILTIVVTRVSLTRQLLAPLLAAVVIGGVGIGGSGVERPAVVFLDVGQGDGALILGTRGTILIDGGPDPVVLERALARYGVREVDVVVASHVHADHLTGFSALIGRHPVGEVWTSFGPHSTPASLALLEMPFEFVVPKPGSSVMVGDIGVTVLGPTRRYDSPNDQSLVIMIDLAGRRYLFSGDVEVRAQRDLGNLDHSILKVPHQGSDTSDRTWLAANAGSAAVISVGENDFGHPAAWVVETLIGAGAVVFRTDQGGDVIFEPDGVRRSGERRHLFG